MTYKLHEVTQPRPAVNKIASQVYYETFEEFSFTRHKFVFLTKSAAFMWLVWLERAVIQFTIGCNNVEFE